MRIRKLEKKDAPYMLEWMQDENVIKDLQARFSEKVLDDCIEFIISSVSDTLNYHFAIVNDFDEYMGTVSLKNINKNKGIAEFAIAIRSCAMGIGYSKFGMDAILKFGKNEIGLKNIFWCVSKNNVRAIKFYDKNGYKRITEYPKEISMSYSEEKLDNLLWYVY